MDNLKRFAIFLTVAALLAVVSLGYRGNEILKRTIVLGLGVDLAAAADDGEKSSSADETAFLRKSTFCANQTDDVSSQNSDSSQMLLVTAEVVSPGNGDDQVGTFSKTVSAEGATVAEALQNIAEKTGKETSLGQCVLVVVGEQLAEVGFVSATEYFATSDSFRESAIICCCEGTAKDIFSCGDALSQSVSLSIADRLAGQSEDIAVPSCNLLDFARSQRELYGTGFLNYVRCEESDNTDSADPDKKQVLFSCRQAAAFRQNKLVAVLTEEETQGLALLNDEVSGNLFSVTDESGLLVTVRVNTKNVNISAKDELKADSDGEQSNKSVIFEIKVELILKPARADSFGAGGQYTAKSDEKISDSELSQTKEQALQSAALFLRRQVEWDVDLLGLHDLLRQKYGTTDWVCNLKMSEMSFELTVDVFEK